MYSFFRKNQKFVMVVMVILMVAFIIPTFFDRGRGGRDAPIGKVGDEQVLQGQVKYAADEFEYLLRRVEIMEQDPPRPPFYLPAVAILAAHRMDRNPNEALGSLITEMREKPDFYYLLQLEARRMGLTPTLNENDLQSLVIRTDDGRRIPFADSTDEDLNNRVRVFFAKLLMVQRAFLRACDTVKLSRPYLDFQIAASSQAIKCYVVDFLLNDYLSKVPDATPEQLQKHFEKFADNMPDMPSETNPFGFGYKFPNRVKVQYIGVPRAEVARVVRASKPDPYDWSVEAYKYYSKHQGEFPATRPATTTAADALTLGPVAATGPTTRPFEEVQEQIINQLIDAQVDRLLPQIVAEIRNKLAADFDTDRAPAGGTATTNASNKFHSFEYLQDLAKQIEARHKVTITVASINDSFKSAPDLRLLPGIGPVFQFAEQATTYAEAFVPESEKSRPEVLSLYEPSRAMVDALGNNYIYRIIEADPAHKPATLDEVKEQVAYDVKRAAAMELAKADAQKLLDQAKTVGLHPAAEQAGLKVIMTGPFSAMAATPIKDYTITTRSLRTFIQKTFALMALVDKKDGPKPVGLIELPADARVAVAELIAIESRMTPDMSPLYSTFLTQRMMYEYRAEIGDAWFNYDSLTQRLGYEPIGGKRHTKPAQASAQ
jgi:hypothetical protein